MKMVDHVLVYLNQFFLPAETIMELFVNIFNRLFEYAW